ncbi:MAG: peptidoglycan D,D-transpeptidase FtsI family protein [Acidithiobacillus sp.]
MNRDAAMPDRHPAMAALPAWRAAVMMGLVGVGLAAIMVQAWRLQVENAGFLREQGAQRYLRHLPLPAMRGAVLDRNGAPLAISVPVKAVWVDPQLFNQQVNRWPQLAQALGLPLPALERRARGGGAEFAFLARQLPPERAAAVMGLHIPGVYTLSESRRYYPLGAVAAPLLGFTNVDGRGIEGVELAYNQWLHGTPGEELGLQDNRGQALSVVQMGPPAEQGRPLTLSIDRNIQYFAYTALAAAVQQFKAQSGSAVVMNVHTGEVLALVSYPSFNPNNRQDYEPGLYGNRAVADTYEPGSVMKPFTIAAALDDGSIQPSSTFDVNTNCFRVASYCIQDDVRHGVLDLAQVLKYSSNIGAAQISLRTPPADLYHMLRTVGFGQVSGVGLPGEAPGTVPAWQGWGIARRAAMAYGYGISVTPLQLAAAYGAIANDGVYVQPSLQRVDEGTQVQGSRVMPVQVARDLQGWLAGVIRRGGTGFLAAIPGYTVAGKTGTSTMADGKGGFYKNRVNTTFVGFAPANHPQLVMAVVVRDPTQGWRFGGVVAAPVFRVTMSAALRVMNVAPDMPATQWNAQMAKRMTTTQARLWAEGAGDAAH